MVKSKKKWIFLYVITFFLIFIYSTNKLDSEDKEFEKEIEKIEYQLDYITTYSEDFSPYNDNVMETATDGEVEEEKMIYLTFDDGPSSVTPKILEILKKYDVKATFFVVSGDNKYKEYIKQMYDDGHTVGVHSDCHEYKKIYSSVDAFLEDFTKCYDIIEKITGKSPTIFRFPGGSINNYNKSTAKDIINEMNRRGFAYFDWNVDSGDATGKLSAEEIYNNVINGVKGRKRAVILMHDSAAKSTTVDALENIIIKLKEDGWQFSSLNNKVKPMIFRIK